MYTVDIYFKHERNTTFETLDDVKDWDLREGALELVREVDGKTFTDIRTTAQHERFVVTENKG